MNDNFIKYIKNEKDISRMKGIGGTLSAIIIAILGWFKLGNFK